MAVAENKPTEGYLPMVNGYYKLPNGDFYPKNLFDKITQVTQGGGDAIGEAVIRSAFRNPDSFNISTVTFHPVPLNNSKVGKFVGHLGNALFVVNVTEVSLKLGAAHATMSPHLQILYPDSLFYLQKSFNLAGIFNLADIPKTTTGIVKLFTSLRRNAAVYYLLKTAFDISPPSLTQNIFTGFSYNVFLDQPLSISPFELGDLKNSDVGYKFPSIVSCNMDTRNKDILYFFPTRSEYLNQRLQSLSITGNISLTSFKGEIKLGHNIHEEITAPDGHLIKPITAIREIRLFELILNDQYTLTSEFKAAVKALSPYEPTSSESVSQWNYFFNQYGTHVVKSVYGGGAINIQLNTNKTFSSDVTKALIYFVQFAEDISLGIVTDKSPMTNQDVQHTLKFIGGDKTYHTEDLTKLPLQNATDLMEKWKQSLALSPTILGTEMKLISISQVAKRVGKNYSAEIERATELLFNSSISSIPQKPPPAFNLYDRQSTPNTELVLGLMERIMMESKKSDERFQQMMIAMQQTQILAEERREKAHKAQLDMIQEQQRKENEDRKHQRDMDYQRQKDQEASKTAEMKLRMDYEERRAKDELEHRKSVAKMQHEVAREQEGLIRQLIGNQRQQGGSCLRQGTDILMADFTQKPVELLETGEMVLDHNLNPVRVGGVLEKFLLNDSFHGFDNQSFFFTDTHLIVGRTGSKDIQIYAKELAKTVLENPLLAYLDVQALPGTSRILQYNPERRNVLPKEVSVFTDPIKYSETTPVYIILVDSADGTYIANGFVCRHEIPPFQHWPKTMSVVFSVVSTPEIKWIEDVPYNLQTVKKIDEIVEGAYLRLQEILNEPGQEGTTADPISDGFDLSSQVVSEVFNNPLYSSFAVGVYGRLGPTLAEKLEVDDSILSESESRRIQTLLQKELANYFEAAFAHAF